MASLPYVAAISKPLPTSSSSLSTNLLPSRLRHPQFPTLSRPSRSSNLSIRCSYAEAGFKEDINSATIDVAADVKTERIVVLGGSGFVGTAICKAAVSNGIDVISLSRSGRPSSSASWADQVTWAAALRRVISRYSATSLPSVPPNNEKAGYGLIQLQKTASIFDVLDSNDHTGIVESESPISMEAAGQMFGFLLYVSDHKFKGNGSTLSIPKVHDRAQVFLKCHSEGSGKRPLYVGTIERWANRPLHLPSTECPSYSRLLILVENMGRVNYGKYLFDKKGILSSVYIDGQPVHSWKMLSVPFHKLNQAHKVAREKMKKAHPKEPCLYSGTFVVDDVKDTYLSFKSWGKGVAFVNGFNIGRFWPSFGPQCNLYVPFPILRHGENVVVILELDSPDPNLVVRSVDQSDFTCGPRRSRGVHQL